ncbi:sulfatase [Aureimonas glaciei]|uniref:Sulfatase n=1 Tax=Aureimonas glaciei TaxID=1776957 RepID=A0A916YET6_9HYPH|nr:sulfatase [Aureimonas glaciei]GGD41707.1 hypothetical protein GCM10011335_50460 [Aureimonas glaciei]
MTPARSDPPPGGTEKTAARFGALRFLVGCVLLAGVVMLPSRPSDLSVDALHGVPVEVLVAASLLLLLRGWLFRLALATLTVLAALLLLSKLADLGTSTALGRPFNPLFDLVLLKDGWTLFSGTVGPAKAAAAVAGALLCFVGATALTAWCLAGARTIRPPRRRLAGGFAAVLAAVACVFVIWLRETPDPAPVFALGAADYAVDRVALMRQSARDLARFEAELAEDPLGDLSEKQLFQALAGRDVYVLFVESYGRSVLSNPAYSERIGPRLAAVEDLIGKAGYAARSGWMTSPTVGGQSWLAHGALLSGLPVTDQNRYGRMIASARKSLNALFRDAGWHTVAVMPAITMDWPESAYFGYDAVYASTGLGYRGLPFNWVTMPDQYTLTAAHRIVAQSTAPVMVEAALISSHAPWTPIPTLVPWEDVGDGRIFNAQALSGDTPAAIWADPERVRAQYLLSIDYALETIGAFVAKFGENAVFVVLGDHQPAGIVTGEDATRDVPFHVIANDPALLQRLDAMALTDGMVPRGDGDVIAMWSFREAFVRAMSDRPTSTGTAENAERGEK